MFTDESFRMKTTCKNGEIEQKIVKDHRTPSQSNVKEREGVTLGSRDAWADATGNLFVRRMAAMKVDEARTGRWSKTRNTLAETKLRRTQCVLANLSTLFADTNLIQSTPQGMANVRELIAPDLLSLVSAIEAGHHHENSCDDTLRYPVESKYLSSVPKGSLRGQDSATKSMLVPICIPSSHSESSSPAVVLSDFMMEASLTARESQTLKEFKNLLHGGPAYLRGMWGCASKAEKSLRENI
ncbi:hypothetical protein IW261DRAFT_1596593 [Armillaria novae-zelandiae]|uniref:Uncharacterized protein n=1 Tax=Armillaria novae-zelandiae TaxID=153914 RepID=A0AA39NWZ5_9AGAR|nr:hypothetical protein IW261DRAFT_1596593 [Armillaria novae-zelandiae]